MQRSLFTDFYILNIAPLQFFWQSYATVLAHPQSWLLGGASGLAGRMASCVCGFFSLVVSASPHSHYLFGCCSLAT